MFPVSLLIVILLTGFVVVNAWVPPKYGIENWEPVQDMRKRLGIEYNYTPSLLNPEVCRDLTVEECRNADQALQEHAKAHRALAEKLRKLRETNPNTGTIKVLVLMVLFSDHQSRPLISKSDIEYMWNTLIPEWFDANSHGAYDVQPIVRDWVVAGGTENYYGFGKQGKTSEFSKAAWNALDACDNTPGWDWRSFDQDDDGKLDSVVIVHSGYGAEDGRVDQYGKDIGDRIWAHAFASTKQDNAWTSKDGSVRLNGYTVTSAFDANEGTVPAKIGLPLHEYMHTFGVIDLYDPTLYGKGGIGNFDIMANPHGIDDASLPGHICAWTKLEAGWVTPTEITHDGIYTLKPLETSSESYQIVLEELFGGKQEKLMFENRQKLEYDIKLPGAGLAIYHIDDLLDDNSVPGYPGDGGFPQNGDHYRVAMLAADGNYDLEKGNNKGDEGDLWQPGQELGPGKGNTVFPNTDTYADFWFSETGITVKVLDNDGMNVRFEIVGLAPAPAGTTPSPTAGTPSPTTAPATDAPTQGPTGAPTGGQGNGNANGNGTPEPTSPTVSPTGGPTLPPYILAGITPRPSPTEQIFSTVGKETGLGPGLGSVTPRPTPERVFSTVAASPSVAPVSTGEAPSECIEITVLGGEETRCQYQIDDGEDIFHYIGTNDTHVRFETSHFVQSTRQGVGVDIPTLRWMATYFIKDGDQFCDKILYPNWTDTSEYVAECSRGFAHIEFYAASGDFSSTKDVAEVPAICNPYGGYTGRKCGWGFKVPCDQNIGSIDYCGGSPTSPPGLGSVTPRPTPEEQVFSTVGKESGTPEPTPNPTPNITPYPTPPPQEYSARVTMTRERVHATDTVRKEGPVDFASFFTSAPKSEQVQKASYTNSVDMSNVRRPGPVSTDRTFDASSSRKSISDSSPFKLFGTSSETKSAGSPSSGSRKSFDSTFTLLDPSSGSESAGSPSSGSRKSFSESSSFAESLRSPLPGSRKLLSESPFFKVLKSSSESQPEPYSSSNSDAFAATSGASPKVFFSVASALILLVETLLDFN